MVQRCLISKFQVILMRHKNSIQPSIKPFLLLNVFWGVWDYMLVKHWHIWASRAVYNRDNVLTRLNAHSTIPYIKHFDSKHKYVVLQQLVIQAYILQCALVNCLIGWSKGIFPGPSATTILFCQCYLLTTCENYRIVGSYQMGIPRSGFKNVRPLA